MSFNIGAAGAFACSDCSRTRKSASDVPFLAQSQESESRLAARRRKRR